MTNTHLNVNTQRELNGLKIIEVGRTSIKLENGIRIHLCEDEIKHLNNEY
jgi:hypothetical protein